MSGKNKPVKRRGSTGKTATGNAKGRFMKGNAGGPGRGHRRGPALAAQPGTPRGDPTGAPIACEAQLELAKAQLGRLRAELAGERAVSARREVEWSLALAVLARHPSVRDEVLAAIWPAESPVPPGYGLLGPADGERAVPRPASPDAAAAPTDVPSPGSRGCGEADEGRPKSVAEQMQRLGLEFGRGGVQPNRAPGQRGDGSRDELLPPGSPQERGRGPYGDEFPG